MEIRPLQIKQLMKNKRTTNIVYRAIIIIIANEFDQEHYKLMHL